MDEKTVKRKFHSFSMAGNAKSKYLETLETSNPESFAECMAMLYTLKTSDRDFGRIPPEPNIIPILIDVSQRTANETQRRMANNAITIFVNMTIVTEQAKIFFDIGKEMVPPVNVFEIGTREILRKALHSSELWTKVLSNMTRNHLLAEECVNFFEKNIDQYKALFKAFVTIPTDNNEECNLDHLSSVFCNITQTTRGRRLICKEIELHVFDDMLSLVHNKKSLERRTSVIGMIKNLCFDKIFHERILEDIDDGILGNILLPLCGPEVYKADEMEKMPIDIQFLAQDKERESVPFLRRCLLDSLLQLCATRPLREHLRKKGVYEVLREYHKWELSNEPTSTLCLKGCENVVDILIKTEEEIGVINYKEIEIPPEMTAEFVRQDTSDIDDDDD